MEHQEQRIRWENLSDYELKKLSEKAKVASIYHRDIEKFQRNPNLSHVVHASLHLFQFIISLVIEVFHHTHHFVNKNRREDDQSIPHLPEERNPVFYIYPCSMIMSTVFAVAWLRTNKLMQRPQIPLIGCFTGAFLMFLIAIMEMKHADIYLDLTEITDAELISHPVFIHNFIMCLLSLFCMNIYLIQAWILVDYWRSIKERNISDASNGLATTDSSANTDISEVVESQAEISESESKMKEVPGKLDPIPQLQKFPSLSSISRSISIVSH